MWMLSRDFFGVAVATLLVYSAVAVAGQASGEPRVVRVAAPPIDQAALSWQIERSGTPERARFINQTSLEAGDTPGTLLTRLAVADPAAARFLRENPAARALFAAPAGVEVRASVDVRQQLHVLSANIEHDAHGARRLQISRQGSRFIARHETLRNDVVVQLRTVRVGDGLGPSLRQAGVPAGVALEFARQIEGRVDLGRDTGPDDTCRLVYEQFNREGTVVGHGRLLAAELTTRRGPLQMVWYAGDGVLPAAFYEPSGQPLKAAPRAAFMMPIAHARVTSHFGGRTHPLFRSNDVHTGIDLAAAHGTQVAAAAGGIVEFVGRKTGYGNLVIVRHTGNYRTYYAHLSSFAKALRAGSEIRQGDSVGRVGSTGWATGAHLHFEVRRGDRPIDPLRTEMLARDRPSEAQLRTFRRQTGPWIGQIALMRTLSPPMIDS
jgi:murein DD-endopeptidase MepM/ murein hydrolase activator NlpD